MKTKIFTLLAVFMVFTPSCKKSTEENKNTDFKEFCAVITNSAPETKTETKDRKNVLWCETDKVSIFRGENINDEYVVKEGFSGKTTTKLVKVDDGSFAAGNETAFDANIAWYPYGNVAYSHYEKESVSSEPIYVLKTPIPEVQKYSLNTFGQGAFPMVAVSSDKTDNKLAFKNLFGVLNIRLKSPNWHYFVKNIIIKSNNNEALSGEAVVRCSNSGTPEVIFENGQSNDFVKLDYGDGVALIPGEEEVEFWIALPFGVYEKGLTITISFSSGKSLKKSTPPITIKRSVMTPMSVLSVNSDDGELYIPDKNFKNYLLNMEADGVKVDMDGDGLLTAKDSKAWNEYYDGKDVEFAISNKFIKSLKGIEHFTSLTSLICRDNYISTLDLSYNVALKKLDCSNNTGLVLDISKNSALTWLDYSNSDIKELDLSKHAALEYLNCENNDIERLDISKNTALKTILCGHNNLKELNISQNAMLESLNCNTNGLTNLDLTNNHFLTYLNCNYNNMTSITFCSTPALTELRCKNNKITDLDLSKCASLYVIECNDNQMSSLDVSVTDIGSGKTNMPLSCRMESLKTLYLKTGWKINYINENRYNGFIHENTVIKYKD